MGITASHHRISWAVVQATQPAVTSRRTFRTASSREFFAVKMAEPPPSGTGQQDKSYFKNSVAKDGKVRCGRVLLLPSALPPTPTSRAFSLPLRVALGLCPNTVRCLAYSYTPRPSRRLRRSQKPRRQLQRKWWTMYPQK